MADRNLLPDELAPEAHVPAQTFYEVGPHAGSVAAQSTKVGWTIRNSRNQIERGFAFLINPQGISRGLGTRAQIFSTKARHYVDDFGPGPGQIQIRQLVASGKVIDGGFYTEREDIQRFIKEIWVPATNGPERTRKRVFFHDHHFERGFEERVYFPADSLSISRDVELHNVWRFELTMISLEKYPYGEIKAEPSDPRTRAGRRYVCKKGDTLEKLARRLAGKKASSKRVKTIREQILKLNPFLKKKRILDDGRTGKPLILHTGEVLTLPR